MQLNINKVIMPRNGKGKLKLTHRIKTKKNLKRASAPRFEYKASNRWKEQNQNEPSSSHIYSKEHVKITKLLKAGVSK